MPVMTRNQPLGAASDFEESASDTGANPSNPGPPPAKKRKTKLAGANEKASGKSSEKSPEQRAKELKDTYAKRRAEIVEEYKQQIDALFGGLVKACDDSNALRVEENTQALDEYVELVHIRAAMEHEILTKLADFEEKTDELSKRLEVALAGLAAEASEKLDVLDDREKERLTA